MAGTCLTPSEAPPPGNPGPPPPGLPGLPPAPTSADEDGGGLAFLRRLFGALLGPLWGIFRNTAPLRPAYIQQYSVALKNLPIGNGPSGTPNVLSLTGNIPAGCRSWLLRNLSATGNVYYWYSDAQTKPATAFQTLPPASAISFDEDPGQLTVQADNVTDASLEVKFAV